MPIFCVAAAVSTYVMYNPDIISMATTTPMTTRSATWDDEEEASEAGSIIPMHKAPS